MAFIGREQELARLRRASQAAGVSVQVLHGRRRVGKTRLIREFLANRDALYFCGLEANARDNLAGLNRALRAFLGQGEAPWQETYAGFFHSLLPIAAGQPLTLVLDGFPALLGAVPELPELLRAFCAQGRQEGARLHLLLAGDTAGMGTLLSPATPALPGQEEAPLALRPFSFFESQRMLLYASASDCAVLHAACGGIPGYLGLLEAGDSLEASLDRLFFQPESPLLEEPGNLLRRELRAPQAYNSILGALARGARKHGDIARETGMESAALNRYLASLEALGFIQREKPLLAEDGRKSRYRLQDGSFRFWYRFVQPRLGDILLGRGDRALAEEVLPQLDSFMEQGFEDILFDYAEAYQAQGRLGGSPKESGRWWGRRPGRGGEARIPLLVLGEEVTYYGAACWHRQPAGADCIKSLEADSRLLPGPGPRYLLLSRAGYTREAEAYAQSRGGVTLIPFR